MVNGYSSMGSSGGCRHHGITSCMSSQGTDWRVRMHYRQAFMHGHTYMMRIYPYQVEIKFLTSNKEPSVCKVKRGSSQVSCHEQRL
jgi:hypothetical protein